MTVVIARRGKFQLRYKSWCGDTIPTTWDLEICADCPNDKGVYVVCSFIPDKDEWPDVKSCGNRMLDALVQQEDIEDIQALVNIAMNIIHKTDQVPLTIYN